MTNLKARPVFLSRALWGAAVVLALMAIGLVMLGLPPIEEGETRAAIGHRRVIGAVMMISLFGMAVSLFQGWIWRRALALRLGGFASIAFLAAGAVAASTQGWMAFWVLPLFACWGLAGMALFVIETAAGRDGPVDHSYHPSYFGVMAGLGWASVAAFIAAAFLGPFLLFEANQPPLVAWGVPFGLLGFSALICVAMDRALYIAWRDGGMRPSAALVRRYGW